MRIEGLDKAVRMLHRLDMTYGYKGKKLKPVMLRAAQICKANIQVEAPLGPTRIIKGRERPGGNLKRGVVAKNFRHDIENIPGAFAGIDYRIAPHAHLVERGHIAENGEHTTANPFFRRGVERSRGVVKLLVTKSIESILRAVAKGYET